MLPEYLNAIFSPLTTNELTVEIFFDFAEEVVNYYHNLYMASIDVESLFTNINLEETIKSWCPENYPRGKLPPPSEAGFGLRLALELGLGAIFLGGNFLRTLRAISTIYSPIILIVVN